MTPTFKRPTSYTSPTGGRRGAGCFDAHVRRGSANPGVDYPCRTGTPVYPLASGRVVGLGYSYTVGWWVAIDYDNGWGSDSLHMRSRPSVKKGARVTTKTRLGFSGATGSAAIGPHLHESLRTRHGFHLFNRGNVDLEKHLTTSAGIPAPHPKPQPTTKPEEGIMSYRAKSETTGKGYVIPELAPPTVIPKWKSGDKNHRHALAYNAAAGGAGFPVMSGDSIRFLLDDNANRRIAYFEEQAVALGLSSQKIADGIAAIRAEISEIKDQEPVVIGPDQTAAIAEAIRADLVEDFADAVEDDLDALAERLVITIPPATLAALTAKLSA